MDYKGVQKTLRSDGYVHYLKCNTVFISIHICQNLSNGTYSKYVQFIECKLYLNKATIILKQTQAPICNCSFNL